METKLLVIGLKNSNSKAFGRLFDLYYPKIKSFLFSIHLAHTVEDVIQETFITVWNKRETIDVEKSFDAYLFTIAKNYALKALKKQLKEEIATSDIVIQDSSARVDQLIDLPYVEQKIKSSLAKLPPQPKAVFELKRYKGMTTKEVALELGIAPKTVDNYMNKALNALKKEMEFFVWLALLFFS